MTKKRRDVAPFSIDYLKSLLHYDPLTGEWHWICNRCGVTKGMRTATQKRARYNTIKIDGATYYSSNLAWFYMTESWPLIEVDHINRKGKDDRWENLRLATHSNNGINRWWPKKSTLPRGVARNGSNYQAMICIKGKPKYLGCFKTAEEAHEAYLKASEFRKEYLP